MDLRGYYIAKISFVNHPVLWDLELDFLNKNGEPYSTIVIAGENGSGKSTVVEELNRIVTGTIRSWCTIVLKNTEGKEIKIQFGSNGKFSVDGMRERNTNLFSKNFDLPSLYSPAGAKFNAEKIRTITSMSMEDGTQYKSINEQVATQINQFMVDMHDLDKNDMADAYKRYLNNQLLATDKKIISRLDQFKISFSNIFSNLTFDDISRESQERVIRFNKDNKKIELKDLSMGEKQIIYKNSFLLMNKMYIKGGLVFMDEPEMGMHPIWQAKLLNNYQYILSDGHREQTSQLIITTHSEQLIKSAIAKKDEVLVISMKRGEENISVNYLTEPLVLSNITSAEANYNAFNIISEDFHIALYSQIQKISSRSKVKGVDEFIMSYLEENSIEGCYKKSSFKSTCYETLPTYIRNILHHRDFTEDYSEEQLSVSIECMIDIIKHDKNNNATN